MWRSQSSFPLPLVHLKSQLTFLSRLRWLLRSRWPAAYHWRPSGRSLLGSTRSFCLSGKLRTFWAPSWNLAARLPGPSCWGPLVCWGCPAPSASWQALFLTDWPAERCGLWFFELCPCKHQTSPVESKIPSLKARLPLSSSEACSFSNWIRR